MATAVSSMRRLTSEASLAQAEGLLCHLNEVFHLMQATNFYEEYEECKVEMRHLKGEIYALGYGLRQDHTGWRLSK